MKSDCIYTFPINIESNRMPLKKINCNRLQCTLRIDDETSTALHWENHEHNAYGENLTRITSIYDCIYHFPIDFKLNEIPGTDWR